MSWLSIAVILTLCFASVQSAPTHCRIPTIEHALFYNAHSGQQLMENIVPSGAMVEMKCGNGTIQGYVGYHTCTFGTWYPFTFGTCQGANVNDCQLQSTTPLITVSSCIYCYQKIPKFHMVNRYLFLVAHYQPFPMYIYGHILTLSDHRLLLFA